MPSITNLRKWTAPRTLVYNAATKPSTTRDAIVLKNQAAIELAKTTYQIKTVAEKVASLTSAVASIDAQIATQVELIQNSAVSGASGSTQATQQAELTALQYRRSTLMDQLSAVKAQATALKTQAESIGSVAVKSAASAITASAAGAYSQSSRNAGGAIKQNASAVAEAYFSQRTSFIRDIMSPNNQPSAVSAASDLWTGSSSNKGMIVTSEQVLKAWNSGSNNAATASSDGHNYGFMFHYNPGSVSMSYYTSPNVDVTMMTSGTEMFNLAGTSGSQGSISLQVVLNRILDMQYYDTSGALKSGNSLSEMYPVPPSSSSDAKMIADMGTMYDVEYLLRVLMGTTMSSYLRGSTTADMGWLPAIPVELHLGKSMRYLGTVNSISINHTLFDARMVPLFSTVDISFARLPDYPASA